MQIQQVSSEKGKKYVVGRVLWVGCGEMRWARLYLLTTHIHSLCAAVVVMVVRLLDGPRRQLEVELVL